MNLATATLTQNKGTPNTNTVIKLPLNIFITPIGW